MLTIAIVDKSYNNTNYAGLFKLDELGVEYEIVSLHLCSTKKSKVLVKDIDLEPDFAQYDWTILIGSEAVKRYSDVTSVQNYTGNRVAERPKQAPEVVSAHGYTNFLVAINPSMVRMRPEIQPVLEQTIKDLHNQILGTVVQAAETFYAPITEKSAAISYLESVLATDITETPILALDTETSGLAARRCYMLGFSMSHKTHQGVYIDGDVVEDEVIELLQQLINSGRKIVFHNAKFDMHITHYHLGLDYSVPIKAGNFHDTMVLHYCLDERAGTHGLKALTIKYTDMGDYDRALTDFKNAYCKQHKMKKEDFTYDLIPFDIMWKYAAADTDATLRLFHKFYGIICNKQTHKVKWLYDNVMMPATVFLQKMENRGLPVSKNRVKLAKKYLYAELARQEKEIYSHPEIAVLEKKQGKVFNCNSVPQLRVLFFDVLGLSPTGITTDTGLASTDKEVMEILSKEHPLPKSILRYKQSLKLLNTFIKKLEANLDQDGKVRTGFGCTTTTSGRLSSSGTLNAQQLPRDNPIVKGCLVAPKGYQIVAKDLSTAEVYYAAVLSGDKNLQSVFLNIVKDPGEYADFHSTIAHMVFKLDCKPSEVKKLYPALRQAAKAITFGILYGSGPGKVAESVNLANLEQCAITGEPLPPLCDTDDAKGYIADYFAKFPKLKVWVDSCHEQIKQVGFLYSFFGRKRRLRNFRSSDRSVIGEEVRSGFNAIIQSGSSDSLLLGCIDADAEIEAKGVDAGIFALVHDSVVAVVKDEDVAEYNEILDRNIQKARENWASENGVLAIEGAPIGIDSDTEDGGSRDYGCGKLAYMLPFLAVIDDFDDRATTIAKDTLEAMKAGANTPAMDDLDKVKAGLMSSRDLDNTAKITEGVMKFPQETMESLEFEAQQLSA